MKYIIMCGGKYGRTPKQLLRVMGEPIIARTVRLLRAYGVKDIAISAQDDRFWHYGIVIHHDNDYVYGKSKHNWLKAFYPTTEPVCYIFGDVYFSENAIREIVHTETDSIEFFASAPPFANVWQRATSRPQWTPARRRQAPSPPRCSQASSATSA